ncbi:MAG: hypothetical protein GAK37_03655 [Pseudomonas sp.]|nr:MAG: hypothetical protein GAK37_03655 [Pseudomonas sp.]
MKTSRPGFLVNFMLLATFSGATIGMAKIELLSNLVYDSVRRHSYLTHPAPVPRP